MKKSIKLLRQGFESSSERTPEFTAFANTFKTELTFALKKKNATEIQFSVGHFYITGFFKVGTQMYYFSISDVREAEHKAICNLLYRTAEHNRDFSGGHNQYAPIVENIHEYLNV